MRKLLILIALVTMAGMASADDKGKGGGDKGGKVKVYDFSGDTIEGDLKRPDGEYVEARQKVDHSNLIRIREDWHDKVMQSSGDL